jgi:hypothetical protein
MTTIGPSLDFADWTIGTVIGGFMMLCCAGLTWAAQQGRFRRSLRVAYWLLLLYSVDLILAALLLLREGGMWLALGCAGLIGTIVLGISGPRMRQLYDEAESRKLMAREFF